MNEWIIGLLITGGVGIGLSAFAKFCPRDKVLGLIEPSAILSGKVLNILFKRWFGASADAVEEGIFGTISYALKGWLDIFYTELTRDNKKK